MKRSEFLKTLGLGAGAILFAPTLLKSIQIEADGFSDWHFYHKGDRYNVFLDRYDDDEIYEMYTVIVVGAGMVFRMKVSEELITEVETYHAIVKDQSICAFDRLKTTRS